MNIFQNVQNYTKLDGLRDLLSQVQKRFSAKEVYYLEFDDTSSFCVKHIGINKDCSNFHKGLVDKLERISFEEGVPVVIMDTSKDPRTIGSPLAEKNMSLLVIPVKIKNSNVGTLTVIREKKFDIKDLNELQSFAENISLILEEKIINLDKILVFKEVGSWLLKKLNIKERRLLIKEFENLFSELSIPLDIGIVFKNGIGYKKLPCEVSNWNALLEICPALKKEKPLDCKLCKFAKTKGFICKRVSINYDIPFAVFSFSDFSDNEWNNIFIDIFSKFTYWYYSVNEIDFVFIYEKIINIIRELVGTDKFTLDNVIIKLSDVLFKMFDNVAIYAYSSKSKANFEFIRVNPKYQSFSDVVHKYCKGFSFKDVFYYNFSGTFSFSLKSRNENIIFDIIFINVGNTFENSINFSKKVEVIKSFLELVSLINYSTEALKYELKDKKEEIKLLYNRNKKLEQEIILLHEKISDLTTKLEYSKFKENILKHINSISSIEDFEKKVDSFIQLIDDYISYKVSSAIIIFFNKMVNKFEKVIFWNIIEYLAENIEYKLKEIENIVSEDKIIKFLSFEGVIYKNDEIFKDLIENFLHGSIGFYLHNIKAMINIPLFLGDDKIGSILLFFSNKVELNENEKKLLSFVAKELSRRLMVIINNQRLGKVRYIYALFQEFLERLHFQHGTTLEKIFDYLNVIFSKMGIKNTFVYKEKREFFVSNSIEFSLEYTSSSNIKSLPFSLKIPTDLLYSFDKVKVFIKDRQIDNRYGFIDSFWDENVNIIFFIPFSNVTSSQFSYEYSNYFVIATSENVDYTQFDIQLFVLIRKLLSLFYDNVFLYNVNVRDKKVLFEVFKVMEDGIIVMDLQKRILHINKSALKILELNINPEDILQRAYSINDLIIDKSGELAKKIISPEELMKQYIEKGIENFEGEDILEFEDKSKIVKYNISLLKYPLDYVPFVSHEQDNFNYLVILRDITEQRNIEKEKDDFVATISHDIKTPLTTMKGYLSALLKYPDKITAEQRDSYLRVVNSEIDRINRMLNNLMDLRKLEGNILKINPVKFDLLKTIKKVVEIFKVSYINFGFEIIGDEDNIFVFADKDKVEQVLHNLLSNAVKYSPTGGKVTISLEKKEDNIIVGISDQGIGIPLEEQDKIFEKYYRTKDILKKKISGKGLGLYITKKIIELHGGKIWVKSELNKGTTFFFSLPL